jgi:hypothetical protein
MNLSRRKFTAGLAAGFVCVCSKPAHLFAADPTRNLRGYLEAGDKPVLITSEGRHIHLESDEPTMKVLGDERLNKADLEALGRGEGDDRFVVGPIHTRSLFVHKDDKRLMITYWCDVCYIRTYSPGKCWCCQKYTDLDLRESDQ